MMPGILLVVPYARQKTNFYCSIYINSTISEHGIPRGYNGLREIEKLHFLSNAAKLGLLRFSVKIKGNNPNNHNPKFYMI